jgi:hypothetical protein
MENFYHFKPFLLVQSFFGFEVLNVKSKSTKLFFNVYNIFLTVIFLFVLKYDFILLLDNINEPLFIGFLNNFLFDIATFSFCCTYKVRQKYSISILQRLNLLDKFLSKHFKCSMNYKKLQNISLILLSISFISILIFLIKSLMNLNNLVEIFQIFASHLFFFFLLLQLSFYAFLLINVQFLLKILLMNVKNSKNIIQSKAETFKNCLDIIFLVMKDIESGFWINISLILGKLVEKDF